MKRDNKKHFERLIKTIEGGEVCAENLRELKDLIKECTEEVYVFVRAAIAEAKSRNLQIMRDYPAADCAEVRFVLGTTKPAWYACQNYVFDEWPAFEAQLVNAPRSCGELTGFIREAAGDFGTEFYSLKSYLRFAVPWESWN